MGLEDSAAGVWTTMAGEGGFGGNFGRNGDWKKSDIPNYFSRPTVGLPGAPRRPRRIRNSRGARVFKISPLPTYPPNRYRDAPPPKKKTKGSCRLGAFFIHGMRGRRRLRFSFPKERSPKNVTDALRRGKKTRHPYFSKDAFCFVIMLSMCIVHMSIKCTCIVPRPVGEHECIQSDRRHKAAYYILRRSILGAKKIKQFLANKTSHILDTFFSLFFQRWPSTSSWSPSASAWSWRRWTTTTMVG